MTREEALQLRHNTWLYHRTRRQSGGQAAFRVRVVGKVRTWKRDPERIEIPIKHGIHNDYGTVTASDLKDWFLTEKEAFENNECVKNERKQIRRHLTTEPHARCKRAGHCFEHEQDPSIESCKEDKS